MSDIIFESMSFALECEREWNRLESSMMRLEHDAILREDEQLEADGKKKFREKVAEFFKKVAEWAKNLYHKVTAAIVSLIAKLTNICKKAEPYKNKTVVASSYEKFIVERFGTWATNFNNKTFENGADLSQIEKMNTAFNDFLSNIEKENKENKVSVSVGKAIDLLKYIEAYRKNLSLSLKAVDTNCKLGIKAANSAGQEDTARLLKEQLTANQATANLVMRLINIGIKTSFKICTTAIKNDNNATKAAEKDAKKEAKRQEAEKATKNESFSLADFYFM